MTLKPEVTAFYEARTGSVQYVVADLAMKKCAIIDPVLDYDEKSGATATIEADRILKFLEGNGYEIEWILDTHPHADHIHGIDDVRQLVFNSGQMMPVWADEPTATALRERFGYIFETPPGSHYPPVCALNRIEGEIRITGAGGLIRLDPFEVVHGNIPALGFRIRGEGSGGLVYLPDVSAIPPEAWSLILGAEVFICDALRRTPHPSHAHLARTLDWFARAGTPRCVITNMHLDMDHDQVMADTPDNVVPAHDGMVIEVAA